jgi:serine/threonine-protein kinase
VVALAAAALVGGILAGSLLRGGPAGAGHAAGDAPPTHLALALPEDANHVQGSATLSLNITPDGRRIVFVAADAGGTLTLNQRRLDESDSTLIASAHPAGALFLSPDSRWVAFETGGHIVKSPLSGGVPVPICTTDDQTRGGCWLDDGTMVVSRSIEGGLWRVSENGGDPVLLVEPDRPGGELSLRWPEALPASRGVLYVVKTARLDSFDDAEIWVLDLRSKARTKLITGGCGPRFWPDTPHSGLLIYGHHNGLWAVRLDLDTLTLSGIPLEVWPDAPLSPDYGLAGFAVARESGTLVYLHGDRAISNTEPVWVDPATGAATPLGVGPGIFGDATVGPSGQVAVGVLAANNYIALVDDRGVLRRLTHGYNVDSPAWTPSGDAIFAPDEHGRMMRIPIADPDQIAPVPGLDNFHTITSWSPDGRLMLCTRESEQTGRDIWLVHADDSAPPEPLLAGVDNEDEAVFSPDGNRIAYSLTQGGVTQVFIRPFPGPGAAQQVSLTGGSQPLWSADGATLYFRHENAFLAAPIPADAAAHPGTPQVLFTGKYLPSRTFYARAAPPKLLLTRPAVTPPDHLDVVLNWVDEVKRRIAAAKP